VVLIAWGTLACAKGAPPPRATDLEGDRGRTLEAAQREAAAGRKREARALYERLVAERPADDEARAGLARLDAWDGHWEESERGYRDLLVRHPDDDELRAGLVDVMLWQRRLPEAESLVEEGLGRKPSSVPLLERKAKILQWSGDATAARDVADRARAVAPDDPDVQRLQERLFRNEVRALYRSEFYPSGYPNLQGAEIAYGRRWRRWFVALETQQLQRFSEVAGERAYNAAYSLGLTYSIAMGWLAGIEGGFGAPAPSIPRARARAFLMAPLGARFSISGTYSFMLYANGISAHVARPAVGVAFDDDTSLEVAYLLTVAVGVRSGGYPRDVRPLHGVSAQLERQIGSIVRLKAGYAHGAQAEQLPASYQLLSLVSDAGWVGAAVRATSWLGVYPLYRIEVLSRSSSPSIVVHTLELGTAVRW
jgi:tetratricopeptide (TPR) repeat protein